MKTLKSPNPRIQRIFDFLSGWREWAVIGALAGAVALLWWVNSRL